MKEKEEKSNNLLTSERKKERSDFVFGLKCVQNVSEKKKEEEDEEDEDGIYLFAYHLSTH